ncbi:MAG: DUF5668 domain-containing protein [Bacteroidales bacterium]|jgi:predicted membrane protein|nr:DUF5668 domain-containing protein [Bacteroidales bacterium]
MTQEHKQNGMLGFGLIIITAGIILLFNRLGFIPYEIEHVLISWQMLLIVFGAYHLITSSSKMVGAVLVVIGIIFILPRTGLIDVDVHNLFWPVILITVGGVLIYNHLNPEKRKWHRTFSDNEITSDEFFESTAIFGGGEKTITSKNLKGGSISCIFGGTKINLINAELDKGTAIVNLNLLFGGTEIIVPSNWKVTSQLTPIFGGVSDKRYINPSDQITDRELILKGSVVFGGAEIKSYT